MEILNGAKWSISNDTFGVFRDNGTTDFTDDTDLNRHKKAQKTQNI